MKHRYFVVYVFRQASVPFLGWLFGSDRMFGNKILTLNSPIETDEELKNIQTLIAFELKKAQVFIFSIQPL